MCTLLASVVWSLPTATRVSRISYSSTRLLSGGFGQKKASIGMEATNGIQRMYDSLSAIIDVEESMRLSTACPSIRSCLDAMNIVNLADLGLDEAYVLNAKDSVCMNIVNSNEFDIQVFVIPKGKQLPLHDHPNMVVLSKVISGVLSVQSFSPKRIGGVTAAGEASLILSTTRTAADGAWLLTPQEGNVHELKAEGTTIVLDVLMPPYMEPDRPCNFYRSVESAGAWMLEEVPAPPNRLLPNTVPYRGQKPVLKEVKWGSMFRRSSPARK